MRATLFRRDADPGQSDDEQDLSENEVRKAKLPSQRNRLLRRRDDRRRVQPFS